MMPMVLCLMGPTASGKTRLAVELASRYPVDIISVDSALVYRGMDIGTAKPSKSIQKLAPHRLIDIRNPDELYSAADFCVDAEKAIADSFEQNRQPVLVGGTMLYFKALQEGLSDLPEQDEVIRQKIDSEAAMIGWPAMHEKLKQIDPLAASRIKPADQQRISRALEVFDITGKPISSLQVAKKKNNYDYFNVALMPEDREKLRQTIADRFDEMLASGFVDEVKKILEQYPKSVDMPSMRSVGYRQMIHYLNAECDYEVMREKAIIASRQLAKRQLTWLRQWPGLNILSSETVTLDSLLALLHNNHILLNS